MRPETDLYSSKSSTYLAIFNAPTPEVIFGSDMLRLTPANIMAHTYCLDEQQWKQTVSPIQSTTVIGPPKDCNPSQNRNAFQHIPNQNQVHAEHSPYYYQQHQIPFLHWEY